MKNKITNSKATKEAIRFLQTFTKAEINDDDLYDKFKAYRYNLKNAKLGPKSIETVLEYLGYKKTVIWTLNKPPDKLIDILTD